MTQNGWWKVGMAFGLVLWGVAIWLRDAQNFPENVAILTALGFGLGPFLILWGLFSSDENLTVMLRRELAEKLGAVATRVVLVLFGLALLAAAIWFLHDHLRP